MKYIRKTTNPVDAILWTGKNLEEIKEFVKEFGAVIEGPDRFFSQIYINYQGVSLVTNQYQYILIGGLKHRFIKIMDRSEFERDYEKA